MKRKNKGISLIVLVITIIVMTILAGTIMLSVSNTGIMDKAEEAVDKTNLQEVQQLAAILWAEKYLDSEGKADIDDLKSAVETGLVKQGIKLENYFIDVRQDGVTIIPIENKVYTEKEIEELDNVFAVGAGENPTSAVAIFDETTETVTIKANGVNDAVITGEGLEHIKQSVKHIVVERGVKTIGENAFLGWENSTLTSIVLSETVTNIECYAINGIDSLKSIVIKSRTINISEVAFTNCRYAKFTFSSDFDLSNSYIDSEALCDCRAFFDEYAVSDEDENFNVEVRINGQSISLKAHQ